MKATDLERLGEIRVPLRVTILLAILALGLVIGYVLMEEQRDAFRFLAAVIGGLAVVHSAYYVAKTLQQTIHRDKLVRAYEMATELNGVDVVKIRVSIEDQNLDADGVSPQVFYQSIKQDPELHVAVRTLLAVFEDISIGIQRGLADEVFLYRSLSYLVPWAAKTFDPYIKKSRQGSQGEKGAEELYSELVALARAWKQGISVIDGKTLPYVG